MSLIICYLLNFLLMTLYIRERKRRKRTEEINVVLKEYYEEALDVIKETKDYNYKIKINYIKNKLKYYESEIKRFEQNRGR